MIKDISRQKELIRKLKSLALKDPDVVGVAAYGSFTRGEQDYWSDIEFSIFVREEKIEDFKENWKDWIGQIDRLLVAFIAYGEHQWVVFENLVRGEFTFFKEAEMGIYDALPISIISVESTVLVDKTEGRELTKICEKLVNKPINIDQEKEFERITSEFWYHSLYGLGLFKRRELWHARQIIDMMRVWLIQLLRLRCEYVEEHWFLPWRHIEREFDKDTLARLNATASEYGEEEIGSSFKRIVSFFQDIASPLAEKRGWEYPEELAERASKMIAKL